MVIIIFQNFETDITRRVRGVRKIQKSSFTLRMIVSESMAAFYIGSIVLTWKRQCSKILISGHYIIAQMWKVICGSLRHVAHNKKSLVILNASDTIGLVFQI